MENDDDRIKIPVFDESIFHPELECEKLGFTKEDLQGLVEFVRWHIRQRDLRTQKPFLRLIQVPKARQKQLIVCKRLELLDELRRLEKLE